jgi:protein PhnA
LAIPGTTKLHRLKQAAMTGDPEEIDCKYEGIEGLVLRAEFVRKR